jgi:membrane protease YdiL (CAAX protease family)
MITKLKEINYSWIKVVLFLYCFLLSSGIFHLILVIPGKPIINIFLILVGSFGRWAYREFVTIMLANQLTSIYWVWIFHTVVNKQSFNSLGLKLNGFKKDLIYGLLIGFGIMIAGISILYSFNPRSFEPIQFSLSHHLLYVIILSLVAFGQEIAFRGFVLQTLSDSMNRYLAIGLTSLAYVFIQAHIGIWGIDFNMIIIQPLVSFNLFLFGVLLGLFCIYRKNLWFAISMNFSWAYFSGPICNSWGMMPLETVFGDSLNHYNLNGSFLLTVLFLIGIGIVHKRFN